MFLWYYSFLYGKVILIYSIIKNLIFSGDKFLLWSFQLNRALFECKCGGANRSWGYELYDCNENILLHFASVSNKRFVNM